MLLRALAAAALVFGAPLAAQQPVTPAPKPAPKSAAKKPAAKKAAPPPAARTADSTFQVALPDSALGSVLITAIVPAADQARGMDAELRAALFDLVSDRPLTALSRLQWLAGATASKSTPGAAQGQQTREDLLFLLAQSYYRLGLSASFRSSAQQLLTLAPTGRYGPIIELQLMLDAYRRGEFAAARGLLPKTEGASDPALAQFVGGLAAYQMGDFAAARASFALVIASGNPAYAPYSRYMDVLASMGGDQAKAGAAYDLLRPIAAASSGTFGDQVRLASAQLAFQAGRYPDAAAAASEVSADGGLLAEAVLARAWSLYRAGQFDSAATLFAQYAQRWPFLPSRDEARLMHGQVLLETRHAAEATGYFAQASDSLGAEIASIQAHLNAAMAQTARALVQARAGGALWVNGAGAGKALELPRDAGAEGSVVVSAYDAAKPPLFPDSAPPSVLSLYDLQARFGAISPPLPADVPQRVLYTPPSSAKAYPSFVSADQSLLAADLAAAVAQYRLRVALGDRALRVAALRNFQLLITEGSANLVVMNKAIAETQDSLDRMSRRLVTARQLLHDAIERQSAATSRAARLNIAKLDSLKRALGPTADSSDLSIIDSEIQTATIYLQLADTVKLGADSTIRRHPVFMLRDSLAARLTSARVLSAQGQQILVVNSVLVGEELARLASSESEQTRIARRDLSTAEQSRAVAEQQMVSMLDVELRARAAQLVQALTHSREAADYGSASAAFFVAIEAKAVAGASPSTTPAATPAPEHR